MQCSTVLKPHASAATAERICNACYSHKLTQSSCLDPRLEGEISLTESYISKNQALEKELGRIRSQTAQVTEEYQQKIEHAQAKLQTLRNSQRTHELQQLLKENQVLRERISELSSVSSDKITKLITGDDRSVVHQCMERLSQAEVANSQLRHEVEQAQRLPRTTAASCCHCIVF